MKILLSPFSFFSGSAHRSNTVRGNGKISTQEREIAHFKKIEVSGAIDLNLTLNSEAIEASVAADENVLSLILTEIVGDVLHIYSRDSFSTQSQPCVNLTAPEVLKVSCSGSSDITIRGIAQTEITLTTSGSGNISASGNTHQAKLRVSGSGSIHCASLDADLLDVKISGSGSVTAKAKARADLKVSGSGEIQVRGNPTIVNSTSSGSGKIHVRM